MVRQLSLSSCNYFPADEINRERTLSEESDNGNLGGDVHMALLMFHLLSFLIYVQSYTRTRKKSSGALFISFVSYSFPFP